MKVTVDRKLKRPIYKQIYEQIRTQILAGDYMPGYRLPSERQLSKTLGIDRTTVVNAYSELKSDGLVASCVGRGTIVLNRCNHDLFPSLKGPSWNFLINAHVSDLEPIIDDEIISIINRRDICSFVGGWTSYESSLAGDLPLPAEMLMDMADHPEDKKIVSPTDGLPDLRDTISQFLFPENDFGLSRDIVITRGARHGIEMVARALIHPGDIVFVEDPTYNNALLEFKKMGAQIMGVKMTPYGMDLDMLESMLAQYRPKLIYTIPTAHNPCGVSTDIAHRVRLIKMAYKNNIVIVEDDPLWGMTCDKSINLPTLKSLDQEGYVIFIGTFAKAVSPRLEIGWICADKQFTRAIKTILNMTTINSNTSAQLMTQRFIESGRLWEHINRVRVIDQKNDRLFSKILEKNPVSGMNWIRGTNGPFKIIFLPDGIKASNLVKYAGSKGVSVLPGTFFTICPDMGESFIRVGFRHLCEKDVISGMRILINSIREMLLELEHKTLKLLGTAYN